MPTLIHPDTGKKVRVWAPLEKKLRFFKKIGFEPKVPAQWFKETCEAKRGEYDTHKDSPQMQFFKTEARFVTLIAGTRFGKSYAASMEVASEIEILPDIIRRPVHWWIVCPIKDLGMLEFAYIQEALEFSGAELTVKEINGYPTLIHPNGSTVQVRTAKTGAERSLMGREVDGAILSEAALFPNLKFIWEHRLRRALGTRRGRLLIPTTPWGYGTLKELYDMGDLGNKKGQEKVFRDWQSLGPFRNIDGGGMDEEEFEQVRRELSPEAFQEQYLGMFVPRSGRVYKEFTLADHVFGDEQEERLLKAAPYNTLEVMLGCDWGVRNETAIVFVAKMGERHYIFDMIYETGMMVPEIADAIKAKLDKWGINSYRAFADHDIHLQDELMRLGIYTEQARKADKVKSIYYVQSLLHPVPVRGNPNKLLPNLMIHKRCQMLINEFLEYHYPETNKESGYQSEIPEKGFDHALDATRYVLYTPRIDLWSKKQKERAK